jgi:hypothetical protein
MDRFAEGARRARRAGVSGFDGTTQGRMSCFP